jgi:pseudouridine synthase
MSRSESGNAAGRSARRGAARGDAGRAAPDAGRGAQHGGRFEVDGQVVEIDMAEWGWDRPVSDPPADPQPEDDGRVRLQKALAHAGVASRRACETLITSGRVTVNGEVQRELGSRIDPAADDVRVDGVVVQLDVSKRYFVLNKPRGVVSTMRDEGGRPDLREFAERVDDRLYNVGRLDTDTSGLLILTNDGELAHRLAHPSFGVQKTYIAKVRGRVTAAVIQRLKDGVQLADGPIHADRAKLLPDGSSRSHSLVEVTLHSGRNRIVRRMLAEVGHPVEELVRRQFGPLHLGTLLVGEMRELSAAERGALLSAVEDGGAGGADDGPDASRSSGSRGAGSGTRGAATAGRPGDGAGARGMRGVAAKGNPHNRRGAQSVSGRGAKKPEEGSGRSGSGRSGSGDAGSGRKDVGPRGQNGKQPGSTGRAGAAGRKGPAAPRQSRGSQKPRGGSKGGAR